MQNNGSLSVLLLYDYWIIIIIIIMVDQGGILYICLYLAAVRLFNPYKCIIFCKIIVHFVYEIINLESNY